MSDEEYELVEETGQNGKPSAVIADKSILGTIEDVPGGTIKNALVKINVTDEVLTEIRGKVAAFLEKWEGTGTKDLYAAAKRLRLDIRPLRVAVEKAAKEGREEANRVRQLWIDAEHAVTDPLNELESLLAAKEGVFEAELQRQAYEKARIERERVEVMYKQLEAVEWAAAGPTGRLVVAQMTDDQFKEELAKATDRFKELQAFRKSEAERKEREEREARELAETNRKEAERLAKIAAEQKAEQDRLAAAQVEQEAANERARQDIENEKAAALKEIQDAKDAAEAKRQADLAVERQKEADRLAAEQKAEAEKEAARLRDLNAPDREKVKLWAQAVDDALVKAPVSILGPLKNTVLEAHGTIQAVVDILFKAAE